MLKLFINIRKSLLLLLSFIFLVSASEGHVEIEADALSIFGDENYSVFEGKVKAKYMNSIIKSDKMVVYFNNDKKIKEIVCEDNVHMSNDNITSISERAKVEVENRVIYLTGDVKVWQKDNYLEAEEIIIYYGSNRVVVNKSKDKRVLIIFKPEGERLTDAIKSKQSEEKD